MAGQQDTQDTAESGSFTRRWLAALAVAAVRVLARWRSLRAGPRQEHLGQCVRTAPGLIGDSWRAAHLAAGDPHTQLYRARQVSNRPPPLGNNEQAGCNGVVLPHQA